MIGGILKSGALPIGVDLGPYGVRLLQLRQRRSGLSVAAASHFDLPLDAEPGGERWFETLRLYLRQHTESSGFVGRQCVLSIDDCFLRVRSIRQPKMPPDEMDRAIRLDAARRLGFDDNQSAEVAWLTAGEVRQGKESRDEIILIGAEQPIVERLTFTASDAGLRPIAVEPAFVGCARAMSRGFRRAADQNIVRVVVDIGYASSCVLILRGNSVAFYKPLEIGGRNLNNAAAERLGLEPGTVADLRRQPMREPGERSGSIDERVDRALYEAIRPILGDLARETALCIRYYSVTFRGSKASQCQIVGGDAREPKLVELMKDATHLPTSIGKPLQGIEIAGAGSLANRRDEHAGWSVATGLSLRATETRRRTRATDHLAPRPESDDAPELETVEKEAA